jgi:hypothetical protein
MSCEPWMVPASERHSQTSANEKPGKDQHVSRCIYAYPWGCSACLVSRSSRRLARPFLGLVRPITASSASALGAPAASSSPARRRGRHAGESENAQVAVLATATLCQEKNTVIRFGGKSRDFAAEPDGGELGQSGLVTDLLEEYCCTKTKLCRCRSETTTICIQIPRRHLLGSCPPKKAGPCYLAPANALTYRHVHSLEALRTIKVCKSRKNRDTVLLPDQIAVRQPRNNSPDCTIFTFRPKHEEISVRLHRAVLTSGQDHGSEGKHSLS